MADGIDYLPDTLHPADETELLQVIERAVIGTGRRSEHPGDRQLAAHVAATVLQGIRESHHVILRLVGEQ